MPEYFFFTTLIIFIGAILQGLTGFGGALFTMPFILLYTAPKWAAPVVILCYTFNRIPAMFMIGKDLMWDHSIVLLAAAAPGVFLGTLLLKYAEPGLIMKILGTFLILISAYKIIAPEFKLVLSRIWALPAGFLSGILGGALATNGPPIVVYAALKPWTKVQVVGMLQSYFFLSGFIIIGAYWYHGLLSVSVVKASAAGTPFAIAGMILGSKINQYISQRNFEVVLSVLLSIMGAFFLMR
jgi:uncharacterized membrane protein YfcA